MLNKIENVYTYSKLNNEITPLEKENRLLALDIAKESIVLLENNGILPLKNKNIALYGDGAISTIKGGSGSGEVNERYSVSIYEGLLNHGFIIENDEEIKEYINNSKLHRLNYEKKKIKEAGFISFKAINMSNIDAGYHNLEYKELTDKDKKNTDTAIYVISRMSGEGADRLLKKGDFYLSDREINNIRFCHKNYKNVILVINSGGMIDLSIIDDINLSAILFIGMLGEEGGNALAKILYEESPSGHLSETWVKDYKDIPYSNEYSYINNDLKNDYYKEDIYVGYRYYETFNIDIRYPFGFGLSYTKFDVTSSISFKDSIKIKLNIKNIGNFIGKYVSQIYVSKPNTNILKPKYELIGFGKTKDININESSSLEIDIPYNYLSCFDENNHQTIIDKGAYIIYLGESLKDLTEIGGINVNEIIVLSNHKDMFNTNIDVLKPTKVNNNINKDSYFNLTKDNIKEIIINDTNPMDLYHDKAKEIVNKLSIKELSYLLTGSGNVDIVIPQIHDVIVPGAAGNSTNKLNKYDLKSFAFCDGPQGLRLVNTAIVKKNSKKIKNVSSGMDMFNFLPKIVKLFGYSKINKGTPIYSYTTAFPIGTNVSQTFNQDLIYKMGDAVAKEMEEFGITIWLAPGMNIKRNPLCGRNFEYYSEDPILSGKIASSIVRGVESHKGCFPCIKHFLCNNQETNRKYTSANVSERALREIYLKGFEIAVKEGNARCLMSSYNKINDIWAGRNKILLTNILKDEWNFKGICMTDWDISHKGLRAYESIDAGINFLMPGDIFQRRAIRKALRKGILNINQVKELAINNLEIILLHNDILKENGFKN